MNLTTRSYTEDDLKLVLRFLAECTRISAPHSYWHPGDFVWTLYQNTTFDATHIGPETRRRRCNRRTSEDKTLEFMHP